MDSCHCESAQGEKLPLACLANGQGGRAGFINSSQDATGRPRGYRGGGRGLGSRGIQAGAANLNSHLSSESKWGQKVPLNGGGKHSPGKGVMVSFVNPKL